MYKNFLGSLIFLFVLAGCGDNKAPDVQSDSCEMTGLQTSFMNYVGMEGDRVFFDFDKFHVTGAEAAKLDKQVQWLLENDHAKVEIVIEGHCDARGTTEYNLALGARRADAVKAYLVSKGVTADRIKTVSFGKDRPAVVGSDDAAYAKNRRAVTIITE